METIVKIVKATEANLTIDKEIRGVVIEPLPRDPKHDAKTGSERYGCDFANLQLENLSALINGEDNLGGLKSKQSGVPRPIYVWKNGNKRIIVDGIKTYLEAKKSGKSFEVKELEFADINEAKAWRWYVNVAANRQLPEDARVWAFLEEFDWLVQKWKKEGRKNQGKKQLSLNLLKLTDFRPRGVFPSDE